MAGYRGMHEHIPAVLQSGLLMTDNLGHLDGQGCAYVVDRKKDLIIRSGQNVYSGGIQDVLYGIEGVSEVAFGTRGSGPGGDGDAACRRELACF